MIREKEKIIISPDSKCSLLPFEVLSLDNQPLCFDKTVVRATSFHSFMSIMNRKYHFGSCLIVGNPWPRSYQKKFEYFLPNNDERKYIINYLDNAISEAETLTRLLPNSTLLIKDKATGDKFISEISKHSLIHFAGHGSVGRILFLSGPLTSLQSSFEPNEFFNLRKAERVYGNNRVNMMQDWHPVTDLDLYDTELVEGSVIFLNACETGVQKYIGGGFYQGLPSVFIKNGAYAVITTSMPIFESSSKDFAIHFYNEFLKSHSVGCSVKKARLYVRERYAVPVHWAPFVHYGLPE